MIEYLSWDSHFFGRQVGRLVLNSSQTPNAHEIINCCTDYDLLYIYCQKKLDIHVNPKIKIAGALIDVGGQIKLQKTLSYYPSNEYSIAPIVKICPYSSSEASEEITSLAKHAGKMSRFKVDPFIPNMYFHNMYNIWIKNSLSCLHICTYNEFTAGLVTLEKEGSTPRIGLISVHEKLQNKGLGGQLVAYIERHCHERGDKVLEVITQSANLRAIRFYLKNGFVEKSQSFLYHWHRQV
jgi:dTDP-4-amino-4,6-dideoxy-D-galactose acyltransferase